MADKYDKTKKDSKYPDGCLRAMYLSAVVTYIVVLTVGLFCNAGVFSVNFVDIRRRPHSVRVNLNQLGIGLPCIANLAVGTFTASWFVYVGLPGTAHYVINVLPACRLVSTVFVWTSIAYLMGLLVMSVDRVLAARRYRHGSLNDDGDRSPEMSARGVWLTVIAVCLYTATISVILSMSSGHNLPMTMICTVYVDNRYFLVVAAGYLLPFAVIIGCMATAAFVINRQDPHSLMIEESGMQASDEEISDQVKDQRRTLKFLAALIICWIVGNVPLIYLLRWSASKDVEPMLILVMVSHLMALPIAMFVLQQRLWHQLRVFVRAVRRHRPRTISYAEPMHYHREEDIVSDSLEGPRLSSAAVRDRMPVPESSGRCVKFGNNCVHQETDQQRDEVTKAEETSADVAVVDRLTGTFVTSRNNFGHAQSSSKFEDHPASVLPAAEDDRTSEKQREAGDNSATKTSGSDTEGDHTGFGYADATKNSSSTG